jgi:hypothetical protein
MSNHTCSVKSGHHKWLRVLSGHHNFCTDTSVKGITNARATYESQDTKFSATLRPSRIQTLCTRVFIISTFVKYILKNIQDLTFTSLLDDSLNFIPHGKLTKNKQIVMKEVKLNTGSTRMKNLRFYSELYL